MVEGTSLPIYTFRGRHSSRQDAFLLDRYQDGCSRPANAKYVLIAPENDEWAKVVNNLRYSVIRQINNFH